MSYTHRCDCGRVWKIVKFPSPMRDKDSEKCYCGEEIISWNGGVIYHAKLIEDIKKEN